MSNPTKEFFTQLLTKGLDKIPHLISENEELKSALQERDATIEQLRAQLDSKWVSASNQPKTEGTYICCTIPPKFLEAFLCGNYIPETENIFGCMFENGKFTEINFSGGDSEVDVDFYIQLPKPPKMLESGK